MAKRPVQSLSQQLLSCDVVLGPLVFKIINWPRDILEDVVLSLAIRYSERPRELKGAEVLKVVLQGAVSAARAVQRRPSAKAAGRKAAWAKAAGKKAA
jgi:hypothetical protein